MGMNGGGAGIVGGESGEGSGNGSFEGVVSSVDTIFGDVLSAVECTAGGSTGKAVESVERTFPFPNASQ